MRFGRHAGRDRRTARLVGALAGLAVVLTGCGVGAEQSARKPRGGTLSVLLGSTVPSWDPQRMPAGPQSAIASRTFLRTLTAYPAAGAGLTPRLAGDLATGTGTVSDGGTTWSFTLRGDAFWQDGKPVTCEDVKYGVSRAFAVEEITGGSPYPVSLLDIPEASDAAGSGRSAYAGPYSGIGQELFDRAVDCTGKVITFRLKVPTYDFDKAVSLPAFGPVRQDQDRGGAGTFSIFSCGPYMMEGEWETGNGGRFVRTRYWEMQKDPIRNAFPDVLDVREEADVEAGLRRIVDDTGTGRYAVTFADAPPRLRGELADRRLAGRVTNPDASDVEMLLPNHASPVMSNPTVRTAFAMATDHEGYVAAVGGETAATATFAALARQIPGHREVSPFGVGLGGDPAGAGAVLAAAGIETPVPVRLAYPDSSITAAGLAVLASGWRKAGFEVTTVPVEGDYDAVVRTAAAAEEFDVFYAAWGAVWPSGSTVLPPLFDGRQIAGPGEVGDNVGRFADPAVDRAIDAALGTGGTLAREAAWGALDEQVAQAGGHIALAQRKRVFVHGSGVAGYGENLFLGGYPDLADIQVPQ